MELESIDIPAANLFISEYLHNQEPVKGFFHYDMNKEEVFRKRYQDLMERDFPREELADCIERFMGPYPMSQEIKTSIEKLKDPASVAVVGGQQAGLLTGPLYTIHKVISIIKLAEEQEKKLGKPVVPVFWIAGEDHDFLEINHVYAPVSGEMKKVSYPEMPSGKKMTSDIPFDRDVMKKWMADYFSLLSERQYTKDMTELLDKACDSSRNFTELFTYLIQAFFKDYGLLLIDAADKNARKLEIPYFAKLIEKAAETTHAVLSMQDSILSHGYGRMIEIEESAANLFYYHEEERLLLDFDPAGGRFSDRNQAVSFTKAELLEELHRHPERFSNNVVTRPLMQEWLFPNLAFIGGPGEIAYWAELKRVFELFGFNMPPVVPRLNITLLERKVEKDLKETGLSLAGVLEEGIEKDRERYLASLTDPGIKKRFDEMKRYLENSYQSLSPLLEKTEAGLKPLSEKNLGYHMRQIDYLEMKTAQSIEKKHETVLRKYTEAGQSLKPHGGFQERTWNVFYFLNYLGMHFIDELMKLDFRFDGTHKVIRL